MSSPMPPQYSNQYQPEKKLTRSMSNKMLAGVCGGIANYLGVDATVVRLIFVVLALAGIMPGLLAYIVAWAVIPVEF